MRKTTAMNILDINNLLPLIPAFSILLVLVLVYAIYKFQVHLKTGAQLDQTSDQDDETSASPANNKATAPLVVPSATKTQGVGLKSESSKDLDDDPHDKPLFPSENIPAPSMGNDRSCDDLYRELLDTDSIEEGLYQDLLGSDTVENEPPSIPTVPTVASASENPVTELKSENLLSEIEDEFLKLEKSLQGNASPDAALKSTLVSNLDLGWHDEPALAPGNNLSAGFDSSAPQNPDIQKTETKLPPQPGKQEPGTPEKKQADDLEAKPALPKPGAIAQEKTGQYINRLKTFQDNLEQRFGSIEAANTERKNVVVDHAAWATRSSIKLKKDENHPDLKKNSFELLESFLFTADQRRAKQ